jgi:hypothetical protein
MLLAINQGILYMDEAQEYALNKLYELEDIVRELKEMCDSEDTEEEIYKAICDAIQKGWSEPPILADDAPDY